MEENSYVVKLRGLPWSTTATDVVSFLEDCKLLKEEESIHLLKYTDGRSSGEAFVELLNEDELNKALLLNKKHIGKRYIDVFKVKESDMTMALKRQSNNSMGAEAVVRLRGLPFGCSKEEIANFFLGLEIAPNGINIITDHIGRCTGDSYVQFLSAESIPVALTKNKQNIQHRYVEVFQSTIDEMMAALARGMHLSENMHKRQSNRFSYPPLMNGPSHGPRTNGFYDDGFAADPYRNAFNPPSLFARELGRGYNNYNRNSATLFGDSFKNYNPYDPPSSGFQRNLPPRIANIMGGIRAPQKRQFLGGYTNNAPQHNSMTGHSVHMRGLPYSTSKDEIAQFFFPLSPVNITLEFNSSGRPSGDANVDFETHHEALEAMKKNKNLIKKRYIELFLRSSYQGCNEYQSSRGGFQSHNQRMSGGDYLAF